MDFIFRFIAILAIGVPLLAWYIVMTNIRNEEYPHWLERIFGLKPVGRMLETVVLTLAVLIVLYMIIFFQLPDNP